MKIKIKSNRDPVSQFREQLLGILRFELEASLDGRVRMAMAI